MPNINIALLVGKQATAGTVAASMTALPVTNWQTELKKEINQPHEHRYSQEEVQTVVQGNQVEEWSAKGEFYYDSTPLLMLSAFGAPTSVLALGVTTHTFKAQDLPPLLSLQWAVAGIQSYQSLDCVVDELGLKYQADGNGMIEWTAKGMGMPETTISTPTPTYTTVRPFKSWMGSVTLGGSAYAKLVSMEITWKRNRSPMRVVNGTVAPNRFLAGARVASVKAVLDFTSTADYVLATTLGEQAVVVTFTDYATSIGTSRNPVLILNLPRLVYTSHSLDFGGDTPLLSVDGLAKYDTSSATAFFLSVANVTTGY